MTEEERLKKELDKSCVETRRSNLAIMIGKLRSWWIDNDEEEELVEDVVRAAKVALEYYEYKWLDLKIELEDKGE